MGEHRRGVGVSAEPVPTSVATAATVRSMGKIRIRYLSPSGRGHRAASGNTEPTHYRYPGPPQSGEECCPQNGVSACRASLCTRHPFYRAPGITCLETKIEMSDAHRRHGRPVCTATGYPRDAEPFWGKTSPPGRTHGPRKGVSRTPGKEKRENSRVTRT